MEITESSASQGREATEERRNAPTVSKEKWHTHAINKMNRGYFLIVGTTRRTANFYQAGKGYESCSYQTAQQLVKEGAVVPAGEHYLGTLYTLADHVRTEVSTPRPKRAAPAPPPMDDDELALLMQQDEELDQSDDSLSADL